MSDRVSIETPRERCLARCSRTFRYGHGDALRGGPFPGSHGEAGDVRRCEHGQVWLFEEMTPHDFTIDHWTPLSRFWNPVQYGRAVRALRSPRSSVDEGNTRDE